MIASFRDREAERIWRGVSADTALRLARYFGTSELFWMGLQADCELEQARRCLGSRLEQEVLPAHGVM